MNKDNSLTTLLLVKENLFKLRVEVTKDMIELSEYLKMIDKKIEEISKEIKKRGD
jgi:hypothetical protein